ncbi:MAG: phosphatidylserine/phosphatidylglycerophosphate/cardiolipin synthase family protein [Chromatiales bacterium]|nr:phosphatidylserine/phosphatidylglycerophosphate/cardiolipin synthase family protein [Chromatiales bacterium]
MTASLVRWLADGEQAFSAMLSVIEGARESIALETYILRDTAVAREIRDALVGAVGRGLRVRVLADALGSISLPASFIEPLVNAGVEFRLFNPLHPRRFLYRNHRKSLCCDGSVAIIGGFNISSEYRGDGVTQGWRDLGLQLHGPLAAEIARSFERIWAFADFAPRRFPRLRRRRQRSPLSATPGELLLCGPGWGSNPLKQAWIRDLRQASDVCVISAYFLPTWRLRRQLMSVVRRGGRVRLLLPGISDVPLAQAAARSLYSRLLRGGVEIWEYQPQVLHAKLVIIDEAVYVGSANFNTRSLHIDYELMVRLKGEEPSRAARKLFDGDLAHARQVTLEEWCARRRPWTRLTERLAYWLMARLDPLAAGWFWQRRS